MTTPAMIGKYAIGTEIGRGMYGTVFKGSNKLTGETVAIKAVVIRTGAGRVADYLETEIAIMKEARHKNIVALYDIERVGAATYMIMEYCEGGEISQLLKAEGPFSEEKAVFFLRQIADALLFMGRLNLVHRDLKPSNLLLLTRDEFPILKIADFGFARQINPTEVAETACGTPLYMAPEILEGKPYDAKSDIWSVGVIFYEMLFGRLPFNAKSQAALLKEIDKGVSFPSDTTVSSKTKNLIRDLLNKSPRLRISIEQLHIEIQPTTATDMPTAMPQTANAVFSPGYGNLLETDVHDAMNSIMPGTSSLQLPSPLAVEKASSTGRSDYLPPMPVGPSRAASIQTTTSVLPPPDSTAVGGVGGSKKVQIDPLLQKYEHGLPIANEASAFAASSSSSFSANNERSASQRSQSFSSSGGGGGSGSLPRPKTNLFRSPSSHRSFIDDSDYVMIDKGYVEVNAFADVVTGSSPPSTNAGASPTSLSRIPEGALPKQQHLSNSPVQSTSASSSPSSPPMFSMSPSSSALSRALYFVGMHPTQPHVDASTNTDAYLDTLKVLQSFAIRPDITQKSDLSVLLQNIEGVAKRAVVVYHYANAKKLQFDQSGQELDAFNAYVLYLKALNLFYVGLEYARQFWNLSQQNFVSSVVQNLRDTFNDCLAKAEQLKLQLQLKTDLGVVTQKDIVLQQTKLLFDYSRHIAKQAAIDELAGNLDSGEAQYTQALLLLDSSNPDVAISSEILTDTDSKTVREYSKSIRKRLQIVKDKREQYGSSRPATSSY